jgi:UPF0042 nucleotide-binding protein
MLGRFLPRYARVDKHSAVVAFGCTGGKHRSVTLAILLTEYLNQQGVRAVCQHRDIERV